MTNDCDQIDKMINLSIGYVNLLAKDNNLEERYNLVSRLAKLKFDYSSEQQAINLAQQLSIALEIYKGEYLISGLPLSFNKAILEKYIGQLSTNFPMIFIMSQNDIDNSLKEPIYGTCYKELEYKYNPQYESQIRLRSIDNLFIPTNTHLVREQPIRLQKDPVELWFCQSIQYQVPKSFISIVLISSDFNSSPDQLLSCKLYLKLLMDHLNEILYDANEAGVYATTNNNLNKIILNFSGFNSGIYQLINQVLSSFYDFDLTRENYQRHLRKHLMDCKSFLMSSPYKQLLSELKRQKIPSIFSTKTMIETNNRHNFRKLIEFQNNIRQVITRSQCRIIIYGNETPSSAIEYSNLVKNKFQLGQMITNHQIKTIQPKANYIVKLTNNKETNLAFSFYWPLGNRIINFKNYCFSLLLSHLLSQPFFDSLRTKQQLGYIVFCKFFREYNNFGIGFCAQAVSKNFSPNKIRFMFEQFIKKTAPEVLRTFKSEEYENLKQSLIHQLMQKPKNMYENFIGIFSEIKDYQEQPNFNRKQEICQIISNISQEQITNFFLTSCDLNKVIELQAINEKYIEDTESNQNISI